MLPRLADCAGYCRVALAAESHRPINRGGRADLGLPFTAHLGKVIGKNVGGAAAFGPMDDCNVSGWKLDSRVDLRQAWSFHFLICPGRYLPTLLR